MDCDGAAPVGVADPDREPDGSGELSNRPQSGGLVGVAGREKRRVGWAAESSYGARSYLVVRPRGNILVDSPRYAAPLVDRIAALPFDAQPGEQYVYGYSTDILGALVERVSGTSLDQFFRTRIFEPLKMGDSSFFLPRAKRDRLATVFR